MSTYYEIGKSTIYKQDIDRIKSLKIPPNWKNVKVSRDATDKVQVIGYDLKGREQRIYHPDWIKRAKELKYKAMNTLSRKYTKFDKYLDKLVNKKDLSKECIIANVIKLIMLLNIRIGNDIYFEENGTCGISTLRKENLKIIGTDYILKFIGKKGVEHSKSIKSLRVKNFLDRIKNIKNDRLFCYQSQNEYIPILASDINSFIKEHLGNTYTAKDLRTYSANKIFKEYLKTCDKPKSEKDIKRNIIAAVKYTSMELGNTPLVCKQSYIDPKNIDRYKEAWS